MPKKESVIPKGLDPHAFREKVQQTLDAAPSARMRATLSKKLAAVDEEIGFKVGPVAEPPKVEAPPIPGEQKEPPPAKTPEKKSSPRKRKPRKKKASSSKSRGSK